MREGTYAFREILEADLVWFDRYIRKHQPAIEAYRGQPAYDLLKAQLDDVQARRDAVVSRLATMHMDERLAGRM